MSDGHLFYHSPCFDGIVSAVLACDFAEVTGLWRRTSLHPVNYDARLTWLSPLPGPAAVVDFLYHPDAQLWADHHVSTFIDEASRESFARRTDALAVYDSRAPSCAGLLWRHLHAAFGHRNGTYETLVRWAEKIDAADYVSVDEAMFSTEPAIRIGASLADPVPAGYTQRLVAALRHAPLEEVADDEEVQRRFRNVRELSAGGLARLRERTSCTPDGIAMFDVDADGVIVNRYAAFHLYPEARYSAGILRSHGHSKITVMRNPWRSFASVNLGEILQRHGGGGHPGVASVRLEPRLAATAPALVEAVIGEIREADRNGGRPP
jgi:hypothetical protein